MESIFLGRSELVGRNLELYKLDHYLSQAKLGIGNVLLIEGEQGIGKTRLIKEWLGAQEQADIRIIIGNCLEEEKRPFYPFLEPLASYFHLSSQIGQDDIEKVSTRIRERHPEMEKMAPALSSFLSAGAFPVRMDGEEPHDQITRYRIFEIVSQLLQSLAKDRPLLLFLDDVHYADEGTLNLFQYISRGARHGKLLIIGAYRREEIYNVSDQRPRPIKEVLQRMSRERLFTELELVCLSLEDTASMVSSIFKGADFPDDFILFLYERTDGNPLYLEQTLAALISEGIIVGDGETWSIQKNYRDTELPSTLGGIVERRLSLLDERSRDLLSLVAVIGESFTYDQLKLISGMDDELLLSQLERLITGAFIVESNSEEETYWISRTALREILYSSVPMERKRTLHGKTAEWLRARYDSGYERVVQSLAKHYFLAGDYAESVWFFSEAGDKARYFHAYRDAQKLYGKGLEALSKLPPDDDRVRQQYSLQMSLAAVLAVTRDMDKSVELYQRSLEQAVIRSWPLEEGRSRLSLGGALVTLHRYEDGITHIQRAIELFTVHGRPQDVVESLQVLGRVHWRLGRYHEALKTYWNSIAFVNVLGEGGLIAKAYLGLAKVYTDLGEADEAQRHFIKALAILEDLDKPNEKAEVLMALGDLNLVIAEYKVAVEHYHTVLQMAKELGDISFKCHANVGLAQVFMAQDRIPEALEYLDGALDEARVIADPLEEARIHRLKGVARGASKSWEDSKGEFEQAIAILGELDIPIELGRTYREYGRMLWASNERAESDKVLEKAENIFIKLHSDKLLAQIREERKKVKRTAH